MSLPNCHYQIFITKFVIIKFIITKFVISKFFITKIVITKLSLPKIRPPKEARQSKLHSKQIISQKMDSFAHPIKNRQYLKEKFWEKKSILSLSLWALEVFLFVLL